MQHLNLTSLLENNSIGLDTSSIPKITLKNSKCPKPRRNKSAFILFSIDMRPQIKGNDGSELNSNQMMVKLAELWKHLPPSEKSRYDLIAREDKLRYLKELEDYSQVFPSECFNNKTKKNHVKKATSAFGFFLKDRKDGVKETYPDYKMADVLKVVSQEWKALTEADRKVYQDRADVEKAVIKEKINEIQTKAKESTKTVNPEAQLKKRKKRLLEGIKGRPEELEVQINFEKMIDARIHELCKGNESLILKDKLAYERDSFNVKTDEINDFEAVIPSLIIEPFDSTKSPEVFECKPEPKVEEKIEAKTEPSIEEVVYKKDIKTEDVNMGRNSLSNQENWSFNNNAKAIKNMSIESNASARTQASITSVTSEDNQSRFQPNNFPSLIKFIAEREELKKQNNRKYSDLIANLLSGSSRKDAEGSQEAPTLDGMFRQAKSLNLLDKSLSCVKPGSAPRAGQFSDVEKIQAIPQRIRSQIMNDTIINALEISAEAQKTQALQQKNKLINFSIGSLASLSSLSSLRGDSSRIQEITQRKRTNINDIIIGALGGSSSLDSLPGLSGFFK